MKKKLKEKHFEIITIVTIMLLLVLTAVNAVQIDDMKTSVDELKTIKIKTVTATTTTEVASSGTDSAESTSVASVIPVGVPSIYGAELGISFDDVSASNPQKADETIGVMAQIDVNTALTGADLERYINALYVIENGMSCEYCCGARSIIFENGEAACGCAHSYAMRGLAKYLITEHGDEYTDSEILEEVGKWKVLFFPGQLTAKAGILAEQGIEVNYLTLTSNQYRGIEQGSSSGAMVGGC